MMQTVEAFGHINSEGSLQIDTSFLLKEGKVKVIIMYAENDETTEEQLWIKSLAINPAFDFLKDSEEDIYTLDHGKPLQ